MCHINKDKGVDIHRHFSETRIWGMVLSNQAVTAARVTHNAFVSFNKQGKEWCYLTWLAPKTSLTCNKLSLQQRKRSLGIKENPTGTYSQKIHCCISKTKKYD